MEIEMNIRVTGVKKTVSRLIAMQARAKLFTPVLLKAKKEIQLANASNFATNGLPVGGWSPLNPQYAAWKMARFPGAPPMVQTGKLFSVSRSDAFSTIQLLNAFYVSSESCAWANVDTAGDSVRLGCANEELANLYRTPIAASVTK